MAGMRADSGRHTSHLPSLAERIARTRRDRHLSPAGSARVRPALPATALEQVIDGVRALDMAEVKAHVDAAHTEQETAHHV